MASLLKGKQLADNTIQLSKLAPETIEALKFVRDPKDACNIATLANIANLASVTVADPDGQGQGYTLLEGDRVCVQAQTNATENGLYVVGTVAGGLAPLTRSDDANEDAEVTHGLSTLITDGAKTSSTYYISTPDPITVGVTAITFQEITPFPGGGPGLNTNDRNVQCLAVTVDGGQVFTGGVVGDPKGKVDVYLNGIQYPVKNNEATANFYFSDDGGTTAINPNAVQTGSTLHANPSVIGFDIETSDFVTLVYEAAS